MKVLGRRLDYCVSLGIERYHGDRSPFSGVPCPAPQFSGPRLWKRNFSANPLRSALHTGVA